jgi:hypothetical protein
LWFVFRRDSRANDHTNSCPDGHAHHGDSHGLADRRTDDGASHGLTDRHTDVGNTVHGNAVHGRSVHGAAVHGLDGCLPC